MEVSIVTLKIDPVGAMSAEQLGLSIAAPSSLFHRKIRRCLIAHIARYSVKGQHLVRHFSIAIHNGIREQVCLPIKVAEFSLDKMVFAAEVESISGGLVEL
ncbi:hypothetical protein [Microvirga sp. 2TAF3]|uniref:hypothetical protein n=1 Tax=Microvirga sp. 2TAF3 TaxID=3233014 RepID=UPI003F9B09E0